MSTSLESIDYVLLAVYLVATMLMGLMIGRKLKTGQDYFLAGRNLPWWAIGMSLVATDIGGTDIIGIGGAAYTHGMAVGNFEWIGCVPAMIVAAFVFIPFFWRLGIYTIPEYLERRFNSAVRTALAFCWLIFMACNLGVMLLASAKMMTALFGWDQSTCIVVTAVLVGIYTCAGGLAAVVYTDMIQCAVMITGCLLVLVFGLWDIGGIANFKSELRRIERERRQQATASASDASDAVEAVDDDAPLEHTSLILPVDTPSPFPWTGILFGLALILSPAYWIGNQAIVQRSLGAKSAFEAKAAYIWGAVLKNIIPVIIAVPGMIAIVKFPQLQDTDQAFPSLVAELLPVGVKGIFLAAFIAALMSSIDSYLNSASTIVTNDFYLRFVNRHADDRAQLRIGRTTTFLLVLWAIAFAFFLIGRSEGLYAIFQTMMSFFQGPALAVLLAGLFWRRATGTGALIGFLTGVTAAISLFALNEPAIYSRLGWEPLFAIAEPFLYFSIWAFIVAFGTLAVVSLFTPPESDEKLSCMITFRPKKGDA